MSMYEQDQWQSEGENRDKLELMKEKSIKEDDAITYNAIKSYENNGAVALIKAIKDLSKSENWWKKIAENDRKAHTENILQLRRQNISIKKKLENIQYEVENSDMVTAIQNIIKILED